MSRAVLVALLLLAGCRGEPPRAAPADTAPAAVPPDSLVLVSPRGAEVWLVEGRTGTDSLGAGCVERLLEIRGGDRRIAVPLLYTAEAPTMVDDTLIAARLWTHCRPGPRYFVNLNTGQPVPLDSLGRPRRPAGR